MVTINRIRVVGVALVLAGCTGVHVRQAQTPEGHGYELACPKEDQCARKAERLCAAGYRIVAQTAPSDSTDARHHWTIACGSADVATPSDGAPPAAAASPAYAPSATAESEPSGPAPTASAQPLGLTLQQAKASSVKLEPGMSRDAVLGALGAPKRTAGQTLAANAGAPAQGLIWTYEWWLDHPPDCSAGVFCRGRNVVLSLTFVQRPGTADAWTLNEWHWSE